MTAANPAGSWYRHGMQDCALDHSAGEPFAAIGGPNQRSQPEPPKYISAKGRERYLSGYVAQALKMYGDDWATKEIV